MISVCLRLLKLKLIHSVSSAHTYFRSIELTNIKTFGDPPQTLEFTNAGGQLSQWTLLLGDNGVGKTTILQCLAESSPDMNSPLKPPPHILKADKDSIFYTPRFLRYLAKPSYPHPFYGRVGSKESMIKVEFVSGCSLGALSKAKRAKPTNEVLLSFQNGDFHHCTTIEDEYASLQPCAYGAFRRIGPTSSALLQIFLEKYPGTAK